MVIYKHIMVISVHIVRCYVCGERRRNIMIRESATGLTSRFQQWNLSIAYFDQLCNINFNTQPYHSNELMPRDFRVPNGTCKVWFTLHETHFAA